MYGIRFNSSLSFLTWKNENKKNDFTAHCFYNGSFSVGDGKCFELFFFYELIFFFNEIYVAGTRLEVNQLYQDLF